MKGTTQISILALFVILVAVGFSVLLTYSSFRYLTDAEKGVPRQEVEDFWRVRAPLGFGLGVIGIAVILSVLRSVRKKQWNEAMSVAGVGAIAVAALVAFLALILSSKDASPALFGVAWIPRAPSFVLVRLLENPARPGTRWRRGSTGKRPESPPRTAQQQAIFEELLRRQEAHRLSVADRAVLARKQFENTPPFSLRTRARWPEGVPVSVTVTGQFAGFMPRQLRATPDYPGGRAIVAYHGGVDLMLERHGEHAGWKDRLAYEPGQQSIGTPRQAGGEIVFDTTVEEAGDTIWQGRVTHPIRVEGAIDDILRPVDSPEVRALIREAINESLRLNEDCSRIVFAPPFDPLLSGVTMGVAVEFLRGESPAATAVLHWRNPIWTVGQSDPQRARSTYGRPEYQDELWATIVGDRDAVCAADTADPEWRVRVRGDAATALEDYDSTAYWLGTVVVTLATVREGSSQ